jgi:hypothetical protein
MFTHRVGSIGAPSRTVFISGRNTKQWEVLDIASRNTNTNIFRDGSAGFKATIDLNKKEVHQGDVSVYIKNVEGESKEHDGKNDTNRRAKLSLDALKLVGVGGHDRIPNYRRIFQLGRD